MTFKKKPYIDDEVIARQVLDKGLFKYKNIIVMGGKEYRMHAERAFNEFGCRLIYPVTGIVGISANINYINELTRKLKNI